MYLFTYGTLKKGFDNPFARKLHASAAFIGEGYFFGKLYRIDWYPGAVYEPGSPCKVYGEIFGISDPALLTDLDEYEEVLEDEAASLYVRKEVPVQLSNGTMLSCITYLYNQPLLHLERIASGIFVN